MHHLVEIAPILGSYDRTFVPVDQHVSRPFGIRVNPRYAKRMTGSALEWSSDERGDVIVLSPVGRIDESTADAFKARLLEAVETEQATAILDLSGISYMSSRGLRALTLAQRAGNKVGKTIVLARPSDTMREILAISRYDMVFRVADTIEEAIGH